MRCLLTGLLTLSLVLMCTADVSLREIADAIVVLAKDIRDGNSRLERHEVRERHLGEHLKKSLAALDKKLNSQSNDVESMRATINSMQVAINQRDERERIQLQRITDLIDGVRSRLQGVSSSSASNSGGAYSSEELRQVKERLDQLIEQGGLGVGISDLVLASDKLREAASNLVIGESKMREHDILAKELVRQLNSGLEQIKELQANVGKSSDDDDSPHLGAILDSLESTQRIISGAAASIQKVSRGDSDNGSENSTLHAIAVLREDIATSAESTARRIVAEMETTRQIISSSQDSLVEELKDTQNKGTKNFESVQATIQGIEKVIFETSDAILDLRKRVDYGTQQVIYENRHAVKNEGKEFKESLDTNFDNLVENILSNQTVSLANLSTKLEAEISQVWRQIGIMYSSLSQSAGTLDRLSSQTENYVNGSLSTMDKMSGKVGQVTQHMSEMDKNLNYLIGKLSMVSQEFNMIKRGLGDALDQARNDFISLQNSLSSLSSADGKRPIVGPIEGEQDLEGQTYRREQE